MPQEHSWPRYENYQGTRRTTLNEHKSNPKEFLNPRRHESALTSCFKKDMQQREATCSEPKTNPETIINNYQFTINTGVQCLAF